MPDSERLVARLKELGMTVSSAESCTGGLIASMIVDVPGASAVFPGGAVTYAERVKTELLGVPAALIEEKGVVSEEVAAAMAEGACRRFSTDAAVSVTGLAGPTGGSEEVPVGRVYIGVTVRGKTRVFREDFPGGRDEVRRAAAKTAIARLVACLPEQ